MQERELQLTKSSTEGLNIELEQSQGLVRELQERIQDDRVGQLEASLKNVQNRASELEFQLSKSKQVCPSFLAPAYNATSYKCLGQRLAQSRP
jgi:predicted RNase H-like nuclease (RuvC/YqgF family)